MAALSELTQSPVLTPGHVLDDAVLLEANRSCKGGSSLSSKVFS